MKSRLAIILAIAVGMVFSTAGASFAVSGLGGSDDAGVAQYGTPTPTPTPPPAPTPTPEATPTPTGTVEAVTVTKKPEPKAKPKAAVAPQTTDVQPAAQVETGTNANELPFTGFAAIPVLLVGGGLLAGGMALRRRNADDA